ncbi:ribose-phosphate diphosphokinase [Acinetobacter nematophilus]|uniref:Ribose-phosphate diphosphokinase n=1 Tax=Acinetobacter nematophilus TaxID=2994642 RepID=A0A9X3IFB7_9GAMM|nr:ribose-phosphate diphosphokinase [Acinetobacter nematophilus]MCX5466628.1 ribose-phosphate diphosphokinase [Acinetobacter nematophilus]
MPIQVKDSKQKVIPIQNIQFAGGERHIQVPADILNSLKGTVQVQAKIANSQDLMDYLLLENVLLHQGLEIDLEIPYFPYARQDRICATGQAFSLEVMTRLLNINHEKFPQQRKSIKVWDAHSGVTEKLLQENTHFFEIENVQPSEMILKNASLQAYLTAQESVLVCPDAGAKQRTKAIANAVNRLRDDEIGMVYCEKRRDPITGKIQNAQVNAEDLTGKTAVITDDICDGGATFIGIAQELKKLNCQQVILYVTHGIFSKGLKVFDGLVDQIFTTNSFPQIENPKLNIIEFSRFSTF